MNVRFYAGTKQEYLALPTHNPIALYFCSDTNELFWGDKLLTDGMRVVPTHADLPSLAEAADGTVYYVTETRNGYILSPDRTASAATSLFGSGWVWLVEGKDGKLEIVSTSNADNPMRVGKNPLLTLDVWEHAYYIDHRNRRADFVRDWWRLVDWNRAAARMKH